MKSSLVAIVDDHTLIRNGLAELVNTFDEYQVLFHAGSYEELVANMNGEKIPDIILLDVNMPGKSGYETSLRLKDSWPQVKVCALSMHDNELSIIRMLRNGVRGYLLKACTANELKLAMDSIIHKGYYYSELLTGHLLHSVRQQGKENNNELSEREIAFLQLACSELSYSEIGRKMFLSPRTIDGYRTRLCEKLNVSSRVGLVLYAIKNRLVDITD
jgi:DNA-binding NarL/FixJ family response regulator